MSLTATFTARAVSATVAASSRAMVGLRGAAIAAVSAVVVTIEAVTAFACAIAGMSTVAASPTFATWLAPLIAATSGVTVTAAADTSLAPSVAGASTVTVILARDGESRGTSAADTRVDSTGNTRTVYQLA